MFESGLNSRYKITAVKKSWKEFNQRLCIYFMKMVQETGFYLLIKAEFWLKFKWMILYKSICSLANQLE